MDTLPPWFLSCWASTHPVVRSNVKSNQRQGLGLLNGLALLFTVEIYKDTPTRRRECLYYLSLGEYKLGNYHQAKDYVSSLLAVEPGNTQAQTLRDRVNDKITQDGLFGMALVGGRRCSLTLGLSATAHGRCRDGDWCHCSGRLLGGRIEKKVVCAAIWPINILCQCFWQTRFSGSTTSSASTRFGFVQQTYGV